MLLDLKLQNFRNFKERAFQFSPQTTVIVGPNASGKTNILEAIALVSTGKSFKALRQEEMVNHKGEIARVVGRIGREEDKKKESLEVVITRGKYGRGKRLLVGGVGKRLVDFVGRLKTVVFRPQELDLITRSPSVRRDFLDNVLGQVDHEYRRSLLSYEKGLRRRNKVLMQIREEGKSVSQLSFWDQILIKNGDYISQKRAELIDFINGSDSLENKTFSVNYDKSAISAARLRKYQNREIASGVTLVGPHRDDLIFKHGIHRLESFGSRGEQRLAVLWLKLTELVYVEKSTGQQPTLLLDDIFSELDPEHRSLISEISLNQQTIVTTTDKQHLENFNDVTKLDL